MEIFADFAVFIDLVLQKLSADLDAILFHFFELVEDFFEEVADQHYMAVY